MIYDLRRGAFLVAIVGANARAASAQFSGPSATVTIVTVPRAAALTSDTTNTLVVVVRDFRAPDQPIEAAVVLLEARNETEPPPHSIRSAQTRPDGRTTFADLNADNVQGVIVRRIGFDPVHVIATFVSRCRQTLEVYIDHAAILTELLWRTPPSPNPGRAVLTTCAPLPNER